MKAMFNACFALTKNRVSLSVFMLLNLTPLAAQTVTDSATKPPHEKGTFNASDLVELVKLDTSMRLDIRYATSNNLASRPIYKEARAFMQRPAAEAFVRVNKELKSLGYGLLIFDGYRPWSVTKLFWDLTPDEKKICS